MQSRSVAVPRTDVLVSTLAVVSVALLTALAAQISITLPGTPVPQTLQTMAVLGGSAYLGSRRGLAAMLPEALRDTALRLLLPLRHAAWGANQNHTLICAYGYGAVFTQPCMYQAMDQLGIAQHLSRFGLLLGDVEALAEGKRAWLEDATWQPLRRLVEDTMVVRDPCELFVAQNLAIDGLLYPLVYARLVDDILSAQGPSAVAMLTQFMSDWFDETRKWVDAVLKTMAAESEANRQQLRSWTLHWTARAAEALTPVVAIVLGDRAGEMVDEQMNQLRTRIAKTGIAP